MYYDDILYEFEFSSGVWTDVSAHVIGSDSGKIGMAGNGPLDRVASTGSFTFSLNNLNNRYTPGNINCTSGFEAGVRFRLRLEYESRTVTRFFGIVPADGIDLDSAAWFGATKVTVVDFMEQMSLHELDLPAFAENKRIDQIIPLILANMPVKPLNTEFYTGQDIFATVFDTTKATTRALQEAAKVAHSELGYVFIRNRLNGDANCGGTMVVSGAGTTAVNGNYYFYDILNTKGRYYNPDRYWIWWDTDTWYLTYDDPFISIYYYSTDAVATPDLVTTWTADIGSAPVPTVALASADEVLVVEGRYTKSGIPVSTVKVWNGATYDEVDAIFDNIAVEDKLSHAKHYYNHVKTVTYPRRVDTSSVVLFKLDRYLTIPFGDTVKVTGRYNDPDQEAESVAGIDMVTPVATTDYLMNEASDGSGADLTAYLSITATYGVNGVEYELENNNPISTITGYVTKLQARGKGVYTYRPVENERRYDASIAVDGKRTLNLTMSYQDNPLVGESFTDNLLDIYMVKRLVIDSFSFVANSSQFLMNAFMDLQVNDKISVVKDSADIDEEYFISAINFTIEEGGAVYVTYELRTASTIPTGNYWKIGDSGYSEIGETTWIGF